MAVVERWRFSASASVLTKPSLPIARRVAAGEYVRVGGDAVCDHCGFAYYDHDEVRFYTFLRIACDGRLLKL